MFTVGEVAEYYRLSAARCVPELSVLVATVVATAAIRARSYIGHPQDGWEPLSGGTIFGFRHPSGRRIVGKEERGFIEPDFQPLLSEEGALERSISSETDGLVGYVGSDSKHGLWQEMGTVTARYPIPPRPFLAKALKEATLEIEVMAGELAVNLLMPKV